MAALGQVKVSDTLTLVTCLCDKERLHMRLHWLPSTVHPDAICNVLGQFGTIMDVSEELCGIPSLLDCKSGVRKITIEISEQQKERLPHKLRVNGCTGLLTFRGRPPMCLKCGEIGHVRGNCPLRRRENTYSQNSQSPPPTAAQRATTDTLTRQRMAFPDESEADLDIAAIQSEQEEALVASSLFNDTALTGVQVSVPYAEEPPSTPDPVCSLESMDFIGPARKADTMENAEHTVKRARTSQPGEISFPLAPPLTMSNRFGALQTSVDPGDTSTD